MKLYKRYLAKEFFTAFAFSLASFSVIRLAVEVFEELKMILDNKVPIGTAVWYFTCGAPYLIIQLLPISTLMAALFTLTQMSKTQELTAFRAAGLSHIRLTMPLLYCALCVSGLNFLLNETIVPAANVRARTIREEQIRKTAYAPGISRDHFTFRSTGGLMVYADHFDGTAGRMTHLTALRVNPTMQIEERWDAAEGQYVAGAWSLSNGVHRFFEDGQEIAAESFTQLPLAGVESPFEFSRPIKRLEELNMWESYQHIEKMRRWGAAAIYELVHFYLKFSFPFANLILCLLGIPFAFLTGRQMGVIFSFSLSVILGFLYWLALGVGISLGTNGAIPPVLAAWIANLVFGMLGVILLYWRKM